MSLAMLAAFLEGLKGAVTAETLEHRLEALLLWLVVSVIAVGVGKWCGFFRPLLPSLPHSFVCFRHLCIAFGLYFVFIAVVLPTMVVAAFSIIHQTSVESMLSDPVVQAWTVIISLLVTAILVVVYSRMVNPHTRDEVWGLLESGRQSVIDFLLGLSSWFIAFPVTSVVAQAAVAALLWVKPDAKLNVDQAAVHFLKSTLSYPMLLGLTVIALTVVAPVVEELLFRGFLQSWLRWRLGTWKAIVVTSLIFAGFHFSVSQEWANVELLPTLFALSLFLGYLYERQRSLLAPIGLHVAFNTISVALILFIDKVL